MAKRLFDLLFSFMMILVLLPVLFFIALAIKVDSGGDIFFSQTRVGLRGKEFQLWKFRTMKPDSEKAGQLTVGARDNRITRIGFFLRKHKLDELPQLWNVLIGEMSMVGPRPEVPRYVAMYNQTQREVLSIKPGITDYASLQYFSESELLAKSSDPESTYINEIMPAKLELNLSYISNHNLINDLKIIGRTVAKMFT
jgi:lipopolysaccharide/colanic/teichoic acid biosynthesis glycosyltransferase